MGLRSRGYYSRNEASAATARGLRVTHIHLTIQDRGRRIRVIGFFKGFRVGGYYGLLSQFKMQDIIFIKGRTHVEDPHVSITKMF